MGAAQELGSSSQSGLGVESLTEEENVLIRVVTRAKKDYKSHWNHQSRIPDRASLIANPFPLQTIAPENNRGRSQTLSNLNSASRFLNESGLPFLKSAAFDETKPGVLHERRRRVVR